MEGKGREGKGKGKGISLKYLCILTSLLDRSNEAFRPHPN